MPLKLQCSGSAQDHYAVLGIARTADEAQIRVAYKRTALAAHPDKGGSNEAFWAVSAAFETLSNPQERSIYDATIAHEEESGQPSAKRRALCAVEVRKAALQRLEAAISAMPRETRHKSLADLPSRVSKLLLEWMQSQKTVGPKGPTYTEEMAESSTEVYGVESSRAAKHSKRRSEELDGVGCQGVHKASSRSKGRNSQLYRAATCCLNLMFLSRSTSLEMALEYHAVFVLCRTTVVDLGSDVASPGVGILQQRIHQAISAACEVVGVSMVDLGLTYRPVLSAVALIGRQINGRATTDLAQALTQRDRLLAARCSGWPALREEWVRMLAERRSLEDAEAHVEAAMRSFLPKRAKIDARHTAHRMRKEQQVLAPNTPEIEEQRRKKELAAAVRAVQRTLDTNE